MKNFESPKNSQIAVAEMQSEHRDVISASGLRSKAIRNVLARGQESEQYVSDLNMVCDGWPVILGSETENTRYVMIAYRDPAPLDDYTTRSYLARVGARVDGVIKPNFMQGYTESDFIIAEALFLDALDLKEHQAPGYSLESGLLAAL